MKATIASIIWNGDMLSEEQATEGQFKESVKEKKWENYLIILGLYLQE